MARRGDALYLRGKSWYLDCCINGVRHQRRLGKGITRSVALELARVQRAAILTGELGIGKKAKDLSFDEARKKFEQWAVASKKPGTVKSYKECLRRLAESCSGKRLGELSPFLVEKHKQARIQAGARVRANRELATLKALFNRCKEWGALRGRQSRRHGEVPQGAPTAASVPRTGGRIQTPRSRPRTVTVDHHRRHPLRSAAPLGSLDAPLVGCGFRAQDSDGPGGLC